MHVNCSVSGLLRPLYYESAIENSSGYPVFCFQEKRQVEFQVRDVRKTFCLRQGSKKRMNDSDPGYFESNS